MLLLAGAALVTVALVAAAVGGGDALSAQEKYPVMPPPVPARPPAPPPKPPLEAQTLKMVPKARKLSTYSFEGRVETLTSDVTVDAPPAYRDNFAVWSARMRGLAKIELVQFLVSTQDAAEDGTVPFRRQVPRFMVELNQQGHPMEPYGTLVQDVQSLIWEGSLDPHGNIKEIHRVAGDVTDDMKDLSFPMLEKIFPRLDGPREIKVGEGFTDVTKLPLPARLTVHGLEDIGMVMTRKYTLKENINGRAVFEVATSLASDPEKPPSEPQVTCVIGGGGTGDAIFDVRKGIFLRSRFPLRLTIEFEAPLSPIPGRPETASPGLGKTHITMGMTFGGEQVLRRIWGEDTD
jgi:hypothetical protein